MAKRKEDRITYEQLVNERREIVLRFLFDEQKTCKDDPERNKVIEWLQQRIKDWADDRKRKGPADT